MTDPEWMQAPEIDEMEVELVCWKGWQDSPTSGLARWGGRVVWFDYLATWDEGEQRWGYDLGLYVLSDSALADAVAWFREKERWYFDPALVALREEVADPYARANLMKERGLVLRDWKGPDLPSRPDAWFRHRRNPSFFGAQTRGRWKLPEDGPA